MDTGNYTLLVVDDIEENRDILSRRLTAEGYEIETANDGQQALDVLNKKKIHLVLLDIMMPEIDGIALLSQIRADSKFDDMPIIMVTAIDVIKVAQDCLQKGACSYVTKPFDIGSVKEKIRQCLKI
jgi:CheY-like chemotaxis protein